LPKLPEQTVEKVVGDVKFEQTEVETVRIMQCEDYTDEETWQETKKRPASLLEGLCEKIGIDLKSYGWRVQDSSGGGDSAVVGFVKVPSDKVQLLLKDSGLREGIFAGKLREGETTKPKIAWLKRDEVIENSDYYKTAVEKALVVGKQLVWRGGGEGANLGILGQKPEVRGAHQWCVRGAPRWWGPGCVQQFLEKLGWADFNERSFSGPKAKNQGWLFVGKAPDENKDAETLVYECGEHTLTMKKWLRQRQTVEATQIDEGRGKTRRHRGGAEKSEAVGRLGHVCGDGGLRGGRKVMKAFIVVFEWTAGVWIQRARLGEKGKPVIPLLLTGAGDERHFVTVKMEAEGWPKELLAELRSDDQVLSTWKGRAGGKKAKRGEEKDEDLDSWLDGAVLLCESFVRSEKMQDGGNPRDGEELAGDS
jgi:hypothetical protein